MTYITSYPLTVIKKLMKAEFAECHPEYEVEFGALNIDDEVLCPYEDECDETMQQLKVMVHVNSPKEDDPAQCWHPWTLFWNCNDSEFETLMRDDQTESYRVNVGLEEYDSEMAQCEKFQKPMFHAPAQYLSFSQIMPYGVDSKFEMPNGCRIRTIGEVMELIMEMVPNLELSEHFAGKDLYVHHINVHDSGVITPCFSLEKEIDDDLLDEDEE